MNPLDLPQNPQSVRFLRPNPSTRKPIHPLNTVNQSKLKQICEANVIGFSVTWEWKTKLCKFFKANLGIVMQN